MLLFVLREGVNEKKNVFFRALPESPNPPPDPNSGNLVLFFGRQKRRFARMTDFFLWHYVRSCDESKVDESESGQMVLK